MTPGERGFKKENEGIATSTSLLHCYNKKLTSEFSHSHNSKTLSQTQLKQYLKKREHYRPERTFGDGETGPKQELGDLGNKTLGVFAVVPEHVLGDGGVANDDEVSGAGGEAVDGAVVLHPLEEREEEGAAEEIGDVVELGGGDGDAGDVVAGGEGAGEGSEPVGAEPGAGLGGAGVRGFVDGGFDGEAIGFWRRSGDSAGREHREGCE